MADSMSVSTRDHSSSTGEIVGTGLHLDMVPAHKLKIQNKSSGLPELPSHQFEYSWWHDVKDGEITGDQMRAPRVRIAPAQDTKSFQKLKDENEELIHHSLKGRQKTQHRKSLANWEKCEKIPRKNVGYILTLGLCTSDKYNSRSLDLWAEAETPNWWGQLRFYLLIIAPLFSKFSPIYHYNLDRTGLILCVGKKLTTCVVRRSDLSWMTCLVLYRRACEKGNGHLVALLIVNDLQHTVLQQYHNG
ncbi:hypothetical protein ScPMuIL_005593 [Solemya velum]